MPWAYGVMFWSGRNRGILSKALRAEGAAPVRAVPVPHFEKNGVPLICDERPGICVLTVPKDLSLEQIDRLRAAWDAAVHRPGAELMLEEGFQLRELVPARGWPDAEYCAA